MVKLSAIKRHPMRDCYILYSPAFTSELPIFGSYDECSRAKEYLEEKLLSMFNQMTDSDKEFVLKKMENEKEILDSKR